MGQGFNDCVDGIEMGAGPLFADVWGEAGAGYGGDNFVWIRMVKNLVVAVRGVCELMREFVYMCDIKK